MRLSRAPWLLLAAGFPLLWAAAGQAAETDKRSPSVFSIEPVVLDGSNSTGATVGIAWLFKGRIVENDLSSAPKRVSDTFDDVADPITSFDVGYRFAGTAAADKERNPKNFQDGLLDAKLLYSGPSGAVAAGLFGKYEADQSFDDTQGVYGFRVTLGRLGLAHPKRLDFIALDINMGRVDPGKDTAREAALGTTELQGYYRWDLEFLYMYPIAARGIEVIEFNYRYFQESSPPAAVKQAGIDRHRLGTVRLGFKNDFFLAYSNGKLPFDSQNDKIFEVGWTYKFK
jgi:hypothetical protein